MPFSAGRGRAAATPSMRGTRFASPVCAASHGRGGGGSAEFPVVLSLTSKMRAACTRRLRWIAAANAVLALALAFASAAQAIEVQVTGVPPEIEKNIKAYLDIASANADVGEARLHRLDRQAPEQIRAAVQPFGYYSPTVDSSLTMEKGQWVAHYGITLGPPTVLKEVDIAVDGPGRDVKPVRDALASIMIKRGDVLNQQRYEDAKQALQQAAYNAGFIDAAYARAQILVHPKVHEAEIHLRLETGRRFYFGAITVEQDILNPHFVARFVPVKTGEPFETDRLIALQQSLSNSGYFANVSVDVQRTEAQDQRIPVVVHTTPRKRQDYTLGFGYGTDTGPRLSLGVELRRLGRRGRSFRSDLRLSSIEQTAAAQYQIPVQNVSTDYVTLRTSLGALDVGDWTTRQLILGTSWHRQWHGTLRRVYLTAQRERYWTASTGAQTATLFFPGMEVSRRKADDPIYPRRAYSWSADIRAASSHFGSDTSYGRLYLSGRLVRPLGKRVRYLLRAEYGALTVGNFDALPPSQRFYAGGEGSVRGYAYQKLSPPSGPEGESLGGRYVFTASAEVDVLLVGNYGAAFFVDEGNASNDPLPHPKLGAGLGLRWKSPVGMIGIDLAHPFDEPGTNYRLYLSIGGEL